MDVDAIAFDAFGTLFDLGELEDDFKQRVVPLTWHATASGHFRPLPEIVASVGIDPAEINRLPLYDDVKPGLDSLRGTPLAVLSNGTVEGIETVVAHAGLAGRFEHLLAADQVAHYKPSPEIYALLPEAFDTEASRVLLVSGNEWDIAGAAQAGLRTVWVARGRDPEWVFGIEPDRVIQEIADLP